MEDSGECGNAVSLEAISAISSRLLRFGLLDDRPINTAKQKMQYLCNVLEL